MPRKKKEEEIERTQAEVAETEATEKTAAESKADDNTEAGAEESVKTAATADAETEEKPKKTSRKKADVTETAAEPGVLANVFDTVSSVTGTVADAVVGGVSSVVSAVTGSSTDDGEGKRVSKRAEKIGVVQSDKMTKTVTVRVDRLVKHPVYRKYVKRRKKFMAHDELGATIGDKVKIIETRPLSARKRWRVVEIIQKAEK